MKHTGPLHHKDMHGHKTYKGRGKDKHAHKSHHDANADHDMDDGFGHDGDGMVGKGGKQSTIPNMTESKNCTYD